MRHDARAGYVHRLRVRMYRIDGPRGELRRCERRDGSGIYWQVKLDAAHGGDWVWPDKLIVDGVGDTVIPACADCGLPFIGGAGELQCRGCSGAAFGPSSRETLERLPPASQPYRRRRSHF